MFLRLCGPPSIPLSFTVGIPHTAGIHRLLRGLPGYLILFDTRAFEHERRLHPSTLPSQSAFFVISMHFTATPRVPRASCAPKGTSFNRGILLSRTILRLT